MTSEQLDGVAYLKRPTRTTTDPRVLESNHCFPRGKGGRTVCSNRTVLCWNTIE